MVKEREQIKKTTDLIVGVAETKAKTAQMNAERALLKIENAKLIKKAGLESLTDKEMKWWMENGKKEFTFFKPSLQQIKDGYAKSIGKTAELVEEKPMYSAMGLSGICLYIAGVDVPYEWVVDYMAHIMGIEVSWDDQLHFEAIRCELHDKLMQCAGLTRNGNDRYSDFFNELDGVLTELAKCPVCKVPTCMTPCEHCNRDFSRKAFGNFVKNYCKNR